MPVNPANKGKRLQGAFDKGVETAKKGRDRACPYERVNMRAKWFEGFDSVEVPKP